MKYFFLLLFPILLQSCFEQGDCSDVSSNVFQARFYNLDGKSARTIVMDSIKMSASDTVMYKKRSVKQVTLPLNPGEEKVTYYFYYEGTTATLDVTYEVRSFALAPDCKAIALVKLTDGTGTVIRDLKIIQPNLTSHEVENIMLYF